MLLPHEIVGAFFRFAPRDLMSELTGPPGESQQKKVLKTMANLETPNL